MKKFIVCHRGALGDFILAWPGIRCLRDLLPSLHFTGVGRPEYMRMAINLGLLDSFVDMEAAGLLDFFSGRGMPAAISGAAGALLWLSAGEECRKMLAVGAELPVACVPPFPAGKIHAALHHCLAIQEYFPIKIPARPAFIADIERKIEKGLAVIHPGSGSPAKNYALSFYRELAAELQKNGYKRVVYILGPCEKGMPAAEFSNGLVREPGSIAELAELLSAAELFVGNDSGVSHLAAALGVSTIAFYKSTDPEIWGVCGSRAINLAAENEEAAISLLQSCLPRIKMSS